MTKTQIQQLIVALLLVVGAGVFLLNSKEAPLGGVPAPASAPAVPADLPPKPPEPDLPPPPPEIEDISVPRDVFLIPPLLIRRLQEQEQATAEEQERLRQQRELASRPEMLPAQQMGGATLKLQGIFWGVARPEAIINRQIVVVGDQIEGAEVEAITRDGVILSQNGTKFELKTEDFRSVDGAQDPSQGWPSGGQLR